MQQLLRELEAGTYVEPSTLTVREHLEAWLEEVVRHRVSPRTRDRCEGIVRRRLIPTLGGVKLTALRPDQVHRCYSGLLDAVRMRLLARNPADDMALP
ncbi:MAG TPA: hypothetical protein VFH61_14290, partial [Thermoleophilia bacterium]|nr:hypothetical protein [Thermoleophilia bacterium]